MSSYICTRCGFETTRKLNLKRHLFRKRICEPTNSDVSIKSIAESYGIEFIPTEKNIVSQNVSQTTYQSHSMTELQRITNCKYCNKSFTSANNCYRHQKHYCKYKKKEITITQDEIEKMKQKINNIQKNINFLKLDKRNKKDKVKIFMKVLEKTDDDKYEVFIDIIFDIKSDPLHVTRKRKLQFALHKKPILKVINEGK